MDKDKDQNLKDQQKPKTPAEILADEFLKTVESTLKKTEKEIWLVKNHDHPYENKK